MDNRKSLPLQFGGQFSSGDPSSIPDGSVWLLQNYLPRPNRWPARPPFVYDSQMAVNGLANFDDPTNKVQRLVAVNTSKAVFLKAATDGSESWGSTVGSAAAVGRISDHTTFRGKFIAMVDNNAGLPSGAISYDGTNFSSAPFNSAIAGRTVTTFNERVYIDYPRVTVTPVDAASFYGAAASTLNGTLQTLVSGTTTVYRFFPTSTAAVCQITSISSPTGTPIAASATDLKYVFRQDFKNNDPLNAVPLSFRVTISGGDPLTDASMRNVAVAVGALRRSNNVTLGGMCLYRCTVAGTTAVAAPSFDGALGAAITDGGVTWVIESMCASIIPAADIPAGGEWVTRYCQITIPWRTNAFAISIDARFSSVATPLLTALNSIDYGLKDGKTNGDPSKRNYGSQLTLGDFYYPFCNTEDGSAATVDMEETVWSEIGDSKAIRAENTYKLREAAGYPTASCVIGNRKLTFKRSAFWQFQGTSDPDIPIRREKINVNVGCLGPRALDVYNDEVFFIGENDVYRYKVGDEEPTGICGDGMREEIMTQGANWVESQTTYKRPLLAIDQYQLLVYVYTQKSKLYVYDLRTKAWATYVLPNSSEADAMLWNQSTNNFYVALGGYGLARLDYATAANDTIDNTANTYPFTPSIIFKPVDLFQPPRYEYVMQGVRFFHAATASQTGQTTTIYYSFDQGKTWSKSVTVTPMLSTNGEYVSLRFPCRQGRASVTIKLDHVGKGGATEWVLSPRAYVDVIVRREERELSNPTMGSATL